MSLFTYLCLNNSPQLTVFAQNLPVASSNAQNQVLIILDASGSMTQSLADGQNKLEGAKRAIIALVDQLPSDTLVGLRVYGSSYFTGCYSGKRLVSMGYNNQTAIASALKGVFAQGPTPISMNLIRAVKDDFLPGNGSKKIVLISDGAETCDVDPCGVAVDLVRSGVQVQIDVVGFGSLEYGDIKQLQCIAASTFGQFHHVATQADLLQAMRSSVQAKTDVQAQVLPPSVGASDKLALPQAELNPPGDAPASSSVLQPEQLQAPSIQRAPSAPKATSPGNIKAPKPARPGANPLEPQQYRL